MDEGAECDNNPDGVEEVFTDFKGIIKALTTEYDDFFQKCDPEKENLCLFGFPNETWDVMLPPEEVPPDIPDPVLGINFPRDGMAANDWLSFVAAYSDSWLLSVAFYHGVKFRLNKSDRSSLFNMINVLPTIFEIVNEASEQQTNKKLSVSNQCSSNGNSISNAMGDSSISVIEEKKEEEEEEEEEEEDEDEDEHEDEDEDEYEEEEDEQEDETVCWICKRQYEYLICCYVRDKWLHGKCVKITQNKVAYIAKIYKCKSCFKRPRPYKK